MKFEEALSLMREGKKVRIHNWRKELYIAIGTDEEDLRVLYVNDFQSDPSLDFDEILSHNWELFDES